MPEFRVISVRKVLIFKYACYERQKKLINKDFSIEPSPAPQGGVLTLSQHPPPILYHPNLRRQNSQTIAAVTRKNMPKTRLNHRVALR
jgi:hypothetical protein